jgi:SNF2 family DNA or RNA helicase
MKDSERKQTIWEHREQTHIIRKLTKELVGRVRSLRYFTIVRDLQKQRSEPPVVSCPECGRDKIPLEEIAILSSCGHAGCYNDVKSAAESETCVYARSGRCKAAARVLNIVKGDTLGVDDYEREGKGKHYGMKLERVIDLIRKRIPSDERVLIFVQFPDLMKKVAEALNANKVQFLEIRGSAALKSKNLEKFQNDSEERVLLLNVMDESASGANLTVANHAIFLSPLLAPSQEIYQANETQAIGRLRRFGQAKTVYIWRFLTRDTIDVDIYEARTGKKFD